MRYGVRLAATAALALSACQKSKDDEVSRVSCGAFDLVVVERLSRKPPAGWDAGFFLYREAGEARTLVDERRAEAAYPPPAPEEGFLELQPAAGTKYAWHVHVSPSAFDRTEYDAIAACLEANLATLQEDIGKSRPPYDQFPPARQPRIVSVRYLDYDGLRRTWRAGGILQELVLEPSGDFYLGFSGRRTLVGFVESDGRHVVLQRDPDSPNLDEPRIDDIVRHLAQFEDAEGRTIFHDYEVEAVSKSELESRRPS